MEPTGVTGTAKCSSQAASLPTHSLQARHGCSLLGHCQTQATHLQPQEKKSNGTTARDGLPEQHSLTVLTFTCNALSHCEWLETQV